MIGFVNRQITILISSSFLMYLWIGFQPQNAYPLPKHRQTIVDSARKVAEHCLNGRRHVPKDLTFYIVPGETFRNGFSEDLAGQTMPNFRTVYIAEGSEGDVIVYAHEMVHTSGVVGHPDTYFKDCHLY